MTSYTPTHWARASIEANSHLQNLVDGDATNATMRRSIESLAKVAVEEAQSRVAGARDAMIIGCGIDFDEFCGPIMNMLKSKGIPYDFKCYWPKTIKHATVDGEDLTSIIQEFENSERDRCDQLIIATSVFPTYEFFDAFFTRSQETIRSTDYLVISAIAASSIPQTVGPRKSLALAESPSAGGRAFHYDEYSERLALDRRYFRHMPASIEAAMFPPSLKSTVDI